MDFLTVSIVLSVKKLNSPGKSPYSVIEEAYQVGERGVVALKAVVARARPAVRRVLERLGQVSPCDVSCQDFQQPITIQ